MEDKKETTEIVSLPSEQNVESTTETTVTPAAAPPSEPVVSSEKEGTSAEKKTEENASSSVSATITSAEPAPVADAAGAAKSEGTATQPTPQPRTSRRNSGVSGIAHRVHRHETRSPAETRLPSRFSDYEVESPRGQSPRVSRQRSNESLKKGTTTKDTSTATKEKEASAATVTKESELKTEQPVEPAPVAPVTETVKPANEKEVDPADELEMMLLSRGALSVEPLAKKPREDKSPSAVPAGNQTTPKKNSTEKSASSAASASSSTKKSRRKSLVEGREARIVKPKFSLEQEMNLSDELQKCLSVLNYMFHQKEYSPFYTPVDPVLLNIPDYYEVIKQPMDMSKIKENLLNGRYADSRQFTADVHLMFENARTYNPVGHVIHTLAVDLEKSFEEQMVKNHVRPPPHSSPASSSSSQSSKLKRQNSSSSKRNSQSSRRQSSKSSSDSSSFSDDNSDSDSGDRNKKHKHHGKHHHHHHHHDRDRKSDRGHGRKRSRSPSDSITDLAAYKEKVHRAELEKLESEIQSLKNQLNKSQKLNKEKFAASARREREANKRSSKSPSKRSPLFFDQRPDPDRPVTDEDKRRISGNINRLPHVRMLPLVAFVQDQIPPLCLVVPGCPPMVPSEIEVDLDTLDNRTLRAVDHKVRQALALAGQARRRAERRQLEKQLQEERQLRYHAGVQMEQPQRMFQAQSLCPTTVMTSQQVAMNYMNNLNNVDSVRRSMNGMSLPGTPGYGGRSTPETPGSAGDVHHIGLDDSMNAGEEEEEVVDNEVNPVIPSDSESSSSSSSSSDSEDDMAPETYAPPPTLVPGTSGAAPVSLSQATAMTSTTSTINGSS